MGNYMMRKSQQNSRGFTLIAALLLLMLLSALSVGLFMMVNTEQRVGNNNIQNSIAQRTAEGGIEKMTNDIANTFFSIQNPQPDDISSLDTLNPDTNTYVGYTLTPDTKPNPVDPAHPLAKTGWNVVQSGEFKGLFAQTWDITLTSVAQTAGGQQAAMSRRVQQVLIPVFQFGAFCNGDCGFFRNPTYDFAGRFHTNGDLYLGAANGNTVTFHDKVEAYGNVIRTVLPNGTDATPNAANDSGTVLIPTTANGCDGAQPACLAMSTTATGRWGSVLGGPGSAYNNGSPSWQNISTSKYGGFLINGNYNLGQGTGAEFLDLPFVNSTSANTLNLQHEIIQKPDLTEDSGSGVGPYRLYNQAQIRVLLVDDPSQLTGGIGDTENVRLANWNNTSSGLDYSCGVPTGAATSTYFATGSTHVPNGSTFSTSTVNPDWYVAPFSPASTSLLTLVPNTTSSPSGIYNAPLNTTAAGAVPPAPAPTISTTANCNQTIANITIKGQTVTPGTCLYPYYSEPAMPMADKNGYSTWNLLDGWLRVEAYENGAWTPVTQEWLGLGFARDTYVPSRTNGANDINPNAILILQEPADRDGSGALDPNGTVGTCTANKVGGVTKSYTCKNYKPPELRKDTLVSATNWQYGKSACAGTPSLTQFNWYPINFYDSREGENWDVNNGLTTPGVNGVMNAVEIDVGNLKKWLAGTTGATGTQISSLAENGYVLYFSDRRGMLTTSGNDAGNYGFEDTINLSSSGVPNGSPEPVPPGKTLSPEDVNEDSTLDTYGAQNLGLGFGYYTGTASVNSKINASTLNPYLRVPTSIVVSGVTTTVPARKNWVSGARHVLKLVDGYLGQVPTPGFTVASENPVYIQGDFNSKPGDTAFTTGVNMANESASSVVADAVSLLSNNWSDSASFTTAQSSTANTAADTYYRLAIGAGKNMNFQNLGDLPANSANYGTDGGMGNFLRLLEDWCGQGNCTLKNLYYKGSMVSLFNSTYATGPFKCCAIVYNPPARNFSFDTLFQTPAGLPPATPMFRDVDNLSSRQLFTQRINATN
jgi:Tfp pilus assembly protein PilX